MRKEIYESHRDVDWVKWLCSGTCETSVVASRDAQVWCGQVGCQGTMKIHRELSAEKVAKEVYQQVRGAQLAPLSLSECRGVSPILRSGSGKLVSQDLPGQQPVSGTFFRAFQIIEDWVGKRASQGKSPTLEIQKK